MLDAFDSTVSEKARAKTCEKDHLDVRDVAEALMTALSNENVLDNEHSNEPWYKALAKGKHADFSAFFTYVKGHVFEAICFDKQSKLDPELCSALDKRLSKLGLSLDETWKKNLLSYAFMHAAIEQLDIKGFDKKACLAALAQWCNVEEKSMNALRRLDDKNLYRSACIDLREALTTGNYGLTVGPIDDLIKVLGNLDDEVQMLPMAPPHPSDKGLLFMARLHKLVNNPNLDVQSDKTLKAMARYLKVEKNIKNMNALVDAYVAALPKEDKGRFIALKSTLDMTLAEGALEQDRVRLDERREQQAKTKKSKAARYQDLIASSKGDPANQALHAMLEQVGNSQDAVKALVEWSKHRGSASYSVQSGTKAHAILAYMHAKIQADPYYRQAFDNLFSEHLSFELKESLEGCKPDPVYDRCFKAIDQVMAEYTACSDYKRALREYVTRVESDYSELLSKRVMIAGLYYLYDLRAELRQAKAGIAGKPFFDVTTEIANLEQRLRLLDQDGIQGNYNFDDKDNFSETVQRPKEFAYTRYFKDSHKIAKAWSRMGDALDGFNDPAWREGHTTYKDGKRQSEQVIRSHSASSSTFFEERRAALSAVSTLERAAQADPKREDVASTSTASSVPTKGAGKKKAEKIPSPTADKMLNKYEKEQAKRRRDASHPVQVVRRGPKSDEF